MNKKLIVTCLAGLFLSVPSIAKDFTIKDIRIEGLQRIEPETVFNYLPINVGGQFTSTKGEQIIKDLYATGYFSDVQVEVQNDQVLLTVIERPIVDSVVVTGGKAISNQLIKDNLKRLGVAEAKVYDPAVLKAVTQGLQQEYLNLGKNNAVVSPKVTELERNRVALTINVDEGVTTRIRKVEFEGNVNFSDGTLKRRMSMGQHNIMSFFTKNDIYAYIKSDVDQKALTKYYKDRGFYDFAIVKFEPEIDIDSPQNMTLKIVLNEGVRYTWGKINVLGDFKEVPMERLQAIADNHNTRFAFNTSKWFNQTQLDNVVSDIKMELGKSGYAKADVQVNPHRNSDNSLGFDIVVNANQKIYVRQINITGNTKTRDEVIRREMRQQENTSYDAQKIKRSKERIGDLGYFEDITVQEVPVEDSADQVDLAVDVKESNVGLLDFSVGYVQDDGVVVSGKFTHDNLWGTGRQIALNVSTGGTSKALTLDYLNPYYTKHGVGAGFDFSAIKFDPNDVETSSYKAKTLTGGLKFVFPVTDYDKINFRIGAEHKRVDLYERSPIYYKNYVAKHGNSSTIYPVSVSWRRSTIDSYLWPTRGYILESQFEATLPSVSDHEFYKLTHQEWWFFPLTQNLTFMLTGQAGYVKGYGHSHDVPFFYNFHTGGMGSIRGYDASSIGPKINNWYGDVDYIGGTRLVTGTAELFFPMPGLKDSQTVRLSVFADAGSLWDGKTRGPLDNFEYKESYKSSFEKELRYSAGIGMVWLSPLGALRFSWAKPLNKKAGDREQAFQFNIGNTF
ncbi:MAG: outer membrane protein assembly factor BamA [Neisseriaceae bacterium]|nr:MAG: outer membrane protein assembly factor BamA [Neisseriaceae bacterium]